VPNPSATLTVSLGRSGGRAWFPKRVTVLAIYTMAHMPTAGRRSLQVATARLTSDNLPMPYLPEQGAHGCFTAVGIAS